MTSEFYKVELIEHLKGGMAFLPLTDLLIEIEFDQIGIRPGGLPYSFYELFYHIFYAQRDIIAFTIEDRYMAHNWPEDYWPSKPAPESPEAWEELKREYKNDSIRLQDYLESSKSELDQPVRHATSEEQTLFREVLLILRHTAYHTGQLLILLRLLKLHKK